MSKKTKSELLSELENMTKEKDILFDELQDTRNEIEELEEEISDLQEKNETLEILIDLIDRFARARSRYAMGILSELEEIEKLTDQIIDIGV